MLVIVALTSLTPPVLAHSELADAFPAPNATLNRAPETVTLTFAAGVQPQGGAITVTGPDDQRYDRQETFTTNINEASVDLLMPERAGDYTVRYRLVSADGHVIGDEYRYRLTSKAIQNSGAGDETPSDDPSPSREASSPGTTDTGANAGRNAILILGIAFIVLAGATLVTSLIVRRRDDSRAHS